MSSNCFARNICYGDVTQIYPSTLWHHHPRLCDIMPRVSVNALTDVFTFVKMSKNVRIVWCDALFQWATSKISGQDVSIIMSSVCTLTETLIMPVNQNRLSSLQMRKISWTTDHTLLESLLVS